MIKNIIFDVGQVLLRQKNIHIDVYLSRIFGTSLKEANQFCSQYRRDLVIGYMNSRNLLNKYKAVTNNSKSIDQLINEYRNKYLADYIGVNQRLIDLVDRLKEKYSLYIFTNTIDVHDQEAVKLHIYEHFLYVFKSYVNHICKPEVKSYLYIVNKIKAQPQECLFIDNSVENIQGAEKAGLKGIVYRNIPQLKSELKNFGVKI